MLSVCARRLSQNTRMHRHAHTPCTDTKDHTSVAISRTSNKSDRGRFAISLVDHPAAGLDPSAPECRKNPQDLQAGGGAHPCSAAGLQPVCLPALSVPSPVVLYRLGRNFAGRGEGSDRASTGGHYRSIRSSTGGHHKMRIT